MTYTLHTAGALAVEAPTLSTRTSCGEAFNWLLAHPDLPAVAVLDDHGHVAGLVSRLIFFARYARQYAPELYARKSILRLANTEPLIVDENTKVGDVSATMLVENPGALVECFVVTANGRYRGVGTGEALLRAKVALLQARERELSLALDGAREASQAKGNFLALMSHELRTPLNAIIGFSEVMNGEVFGPLGNARYRDYAGDIHGAGKHLLALINDILDLSKAEAGKFDLHCTGVDVGELIGECVRLMRGKAMDGGLSLTKSVAAALPPLYADRLRLKQMLLNLLSNAVKFTPAGGRVRVTAGLRDGGIRIAVRDTGIGIAPDMIAVALEPFRQIASPLARNAEGTGLGLALVKTLAELQDGRLDLTSHLNRGTEAALCFAPSRSRAWPHLKSA